MRTDFAKKCKEFTDWIDEQKLAISKDGTLEEKLAAVQQVNKRKIGQIWPRKIRLLTWYSLWPIEV